MENILQNYLQTIERFNSKTIPNHVYFKKPYVEDYLFPFISIPNDDDLKRKIEDEIDLNYQDILFFIFSVFHFSKEKKQKIQFFFQQNSPSSILLSHSILYFQIKYTQFFFIIHELFYQDLQILHNDILYIISSYHNQFQNYPIQNYIKNRYHKKNNEIKQLLFLHNSIIDLSILYIELIKQIFIKCDISEKSFKNQILYEHFIKYILSPWYDIHKTYDVNGNINNNNNNIHSNKKKNTILQKLFCVSNLNE